MLVRRCDPATTDEVQSNEVSGVSMQIMLGRETGAPHFAIRHFVVDAGGHTPRHQHDWEHEIYMIEGCLQAECDGQRQEIAAGDVVFVPGGQLHQFVNESDLPARFLCMVPVSTACCESVPGS